MGFLKPYAEKIYGLLRIVVRDRAAGAQGATAPGPGAVRLLASAPATFGLQGIISGRPALHGLASSYGSRARPVRPREESGHEPG